MAALRSIVMDPTMPEAFRDAAYRLAADPGLFNDVDATHQTITLTPTGFDWSQTDGIIGRADVEEFAVKDFQIRTVLAWRILIDSATHGHNVDKADGTIRPAEVDAFLGDRKVPPLVRQALWDFYATNNDDFVRGIDPFEASDDDRRSDELRAAVAKGFVIVPTAGLFGTGMKFAPSPEAITSGDATSTRGAYTTSNARGTLVGAAAAYVASLLVEPIIDTITDKAHELTSPGPPASFRIIDPTTGQPRDIDTDLLRRYGPDQLHQAIYWLAATGQPPDPNHLPPISSGPLNQRLGLDSPDDPIGISAHQYLDSQGNLRWTDTNHLVSQHPNRTRYQDNNGTWRWTDTDERVAVGEECLETPDNAVIEDLSPEEQDIFRSAADVYFSSRFDEIRRAHLANEGVEIKIGGTVVMYEPDLPASGMTLFGEQGFVVGPEAFDSEAELAQTVLHEFHRLLTSQSRAGVSGSLADAETCSAAAFAAGNYLTLLRRGRP